MGLLVDGFQHDGSQIARYRAIELAGRCRIVVRNPLRQLSDVLAVKSWLQAEHFVEGDAQ